MYPWLADVRAVAGNATSQEGGSGRANTVEKASECMPWQESGGDHGAALYRHREIFQNLGRTTGSMVRKELRLRDTPRLELHDELKLPARRGPVKPNVDDEPPAKPGVGNPKNGYLPKLLNGEHNRDLYQSIETANSNQMSLADESAVELDLQHDGCETAHGAR